QVRGARLAVGALRLDAAPQPAEEIELPERINAQLVALARAPGPGRRRRLVGALQELARGSGRGHARQARPAGVAHERARALVAGERDAQVVIRRERLLDQAREQRVVERAPELALHV